jgi:hypothetical protein
MLSKNRSLQVLSLTGVRNKEALEDLGRDERVQLGRHIRDTEEGLGRACYADQGYTESLNLTMYHFTT